MTTPQLRVLSSGTCRICYFCLAFVWCLSLCVGLLFAFITRSVTVSLMYIAPMCRVSIFGLVMTLLFPLLLSAVAVKFSVFVIIYPIVFLDGISLGYFMLGAIFAFGSAGWLICLLLGFSKLLFTIPKFWFFLKCFSGRNKWMPGLWRCICAALIIGTLDYFVVSPFLTALVV